MDSACPKELATEILSDSDHSTKVAPTTLNKAYTKGHFDSVLVGIKYVHDLICYPNFPE